MSESEFEEMINENPDASEYGWLEEETETEARERLCPEERQADIDGEKRWEAMVAAGEINDPFGEG